MVEEDQGYEDQHKDDDCTDVDYCIQQADLEITVGGVRGQILGDDKEDDVNDHRDQEEYPGDPGDDVGGSYRL